MPEADAVERAQLERVERRAGDDDEPVAPARERLGLLLERERVSRPLARAAPEPLAQPVVGLLDGDVAGRGAGGEHTRDLAGHGRVAEEHDRRRLLAPPLAVRREVRDHVVEVVVERVLRSLLDHAEPAELVEQRLDLGRRHAFARGDLVRRGRAVETPDQAEERAGAAVVGERERHRVPRAVAQLDDVGPVRDDGVVALETRRHQSGTPSTCAWTSASNTPSMPSASCTSSS